MPLSAPAALAVSVVLSALGAMVLCLLVALYGFTPASELSPRRARRRLLITGIGHAVAASCFAATAILIAVVLVQPLRSGPPAPRDDARVPALGAQLAGQASRLTEQASRLARQESRLTEAEARLEAIDDAVRRAAARASSARMASDRVPAPEVVVVRPAPAPRVTVFRPYDVEGSAFTTPRAPAATAPTSAPAATPPAPAAPAAHRVATEPTAPAGRTAPPAAPSRPGLIDKLREDWATIKRSFESGEDDLRRAMEDTRRNFRGLVGE